MGDIFDETAESKESGGGNYLGPGKGRVIVSKVTNRSGKKGNSIVIEMLVTASAMTDRVLDKNGKVVEPNGVGTSASKVFNFTKHASAAGNFRKLCRIMLCDALGAVDPSVFDENASLEVKKQAAALMRECVEKGRFRGISLSYESYQHTTQAKNEITLHNFSAEPQTAEQVKANRGVLAMSYDELVAHLEGRLAGTVAAPSKDLLGDLGLDD